jgi:hypothetical protein
MTGTYLEYRLRDDDSHITTLSHTIYPLRSIHRCNLSGTFLTEATNRSFRQYELTADTTLQVTAVRDLATVAVF